MEVHIIDESEIKSYKELRKRTKETMKHMKREYKYIPGIGHKLGNYVLPDNILERMKKLTDRSQEVQKEVGFQFCTDGNIDMNGNIPISTGMTCVGEKDCLTTIEKYRQQCPPNKIRIGEFHSHPNRYDANMSHPDANNAYMIGIECIGALKEINCFIRKSDRINEDIHDKFLSLYNEIEKRIYQVQKYEKRLSKEGFNEDKHKFFRDNFKETKIE
jgi:hypothetical protein